jgi:glycine C-acetyltransferase
MIVITFSKAFCSLGGALVANKEITNYVNFYARCRMFSVAIPPSVAGSIIKVLELGTGKDGYRRRKALIDNTKYMRSLLENKVDILGGDTWVIPVLYKDEKITMELGRYLHDSGMDAGCLFFPVVPKGKARIRLFISSSHTKKHLKRAADIIIKAAGKFNFLKQYS